jgi:hypothetical protein
MITEAARRYDWLTAQMGRRQRCLSLSDGEQEEFWRQLERQWVEMTDEEREDRTINIGVSAMAWIFASYRPQSLRGLKAEFLTLDDYTHWPEPT